VRLVQQRDWKGEQQVELRQAAVRQRADKHQQGDLVQVVAQAIDLSLVVYKRAAARCLAPRKCTGVNYREELMAGVPYVQQLQRKELHRRIASLPLGGRTGYVGINLLR
jgi:hypothetical protein